MNWSTLIVNILGAFLLGVVAAHFDQSSTSTKHIIQLRLFLTTGLAGGLTTYGTVIVATVHAASPEVFLQSLLHIFLGIICAGAGFSATARKMWYPR